MFCQRHIKIISCTVTAKIHTHLVIAMFQAFLRVRLYLGGGGAKGNNNRHPRAAGESRGYLTVS